MKIGKQKAAAATFLIEITEPCRLSTEDVGVMRHADRGDRVTLGLADAVDVVNAGRGVAIDESGHRLQLRVALERAGIPATAVYEL